MMRAKRTFGEISLGIFHFREKAQTLSRLAWRDPARCLRSEGGKPMEGGHEVLSEKNQQDMATKFAWFPIKIDGFFIGNYIFDSPRYPG
jgi:hypothetical protein